MLQVMLLHAYHDLTICTLQVPKGPELTPEQARTPTAPSLPPPIVPKPSVPTTPELRTPSPPTREPMQLLASAGIGPKARQAAFAPLLVQQRSAGVHGELFAYCK